MKNTILKKCRLCRSSGKKLFLKGSRCSSPKCPLYGKSVNPPGQKSTSRRRRLSDYGIQLKEKQELKKVYGVGEKQLRHYFIEARKHRQATGELMIQLLETRLDNLVYRLGFVPSRKMARQFVSHKHVLVNDKIVNIPSYRVKPGEILSVEAQALAILEVKVALANKDYIIPGWLEKKASVGKMIKLPQREDIELDVNEQLIVEFYSR